MVETREGQMEKMMNILDYMTDKQVAEVLRAMPDGELAKMARSLVSTWDQVYIDKHGVRRKTSVLPPDLDKPVSPDTTSEVPSSSTGMQTMKKEHTNAFRARVLAAFAENRGRAKSTTLKRFMYDKVTGREVDEKRLIKTLQELKAKGKLTYSNSVWYIAQ